ncbi:Predicted NAD/FAD-binding protein [Noviherbaspirillum humi]|uniref:Predicted NAD/FAD-binding protein n=1 Tax=Noviherbaspirillum humi TaxID=1688639 RepID=A0A239CHT3_9BURK|nr:FAD-dependent oxidoreductase [Noviherbaspirillum humi]SNS19509.1 Predicted NAD/FAD-binding protein [Noviherbaspirillum humi]
MKIAVVGSGISGLSGAYRLSQAGHAVTLLEANDYFGGHTHTVDVTLDGKTHGVDTGFLVFNHRTYPNLVRLFDELGIATSATDMSFSVKLPLGGAAPRWLEWAGSNLDTVFAQRANLLRPAFLRMLRDILRFNRQTTQLATDGRLDGDITLGDFLRRHRYGDAFRDWYLLPMAGCIWSCPTEQMLAFPLATFVRFCHNHGLLQVNDRPQWHTVTGGARHYVDKLLAGIHDKRLNCPVRAITREGHGAAASIRIETADGIQTYDHVLLATHSDQALRLLQDASRAERQVLSAIGYQPNRAVLHTDANCLPQRRKAWSAWNYESENGREPRVCVHYLINKLQPLPFETPVIVSLNPIREPAPGTVLGEFDYAHPVFDAAAVEAQRRLMLIQGHRSTWFAGAWTGYGFHEDGLKSGLLAAQAIAERGLAVAAAPVAA